MEFLPVFLCYVGIVLLILASFETGFRIGLGKRDRHDKEAPNMIGPMVGGLLGMLAFVLAFTFSMAASQHDRRKQNVLEDANAIGTAYLRMDLLVGPDQGETKNLLREYVKVRLQVVAGEIELEDGLAKSVEIQKQVWTRVAAAAKLNPGPNTSLVVQATNELIDMHERRTTAALHDRIPGSIWVALFFISTLTMATMGAQAGLSESRRLIAVIPLALAFAALATVIVDLDRPSKGLITVGQQAMINLQNSMAADSE